VKFLLNDKTTLSDLLSLNLHKYEDEVKNIVDKAVKEMSMEKVLKELNTTWTTMEFEHVRHPRTGITMLQTSEELIETLEDNQVQLLPRFIIYSFINHKRNNTGDFGHRPPIHSLFRHSVVPPLVGARFLLQPLELSATGHPVITLFNCFPSTA